MPAPKNTAEMINVQQGRGIIKEKTLIEVAKILQTSLAPLYIGSWQLTNGVRIFADKVSVVIYCPGCTWTATMSFLPWDPLFSTNNYYRH